MRQEGRKEVIWAGGAESVGPSRDIRSVLDFLISAVINKIWMGAGRVLNFSIPRNDPKVTAIRNF